MQIDYLSLGSCVGRAGLELTEILDSDDIVFFFKHTSLDGRKEMPLPVSLSRGKLNRDMEDLYEKIKSFDAPDYELSKLKEQYEHMKKLKEEMNEY